MLTVGFPRMHKEPGERRDWLPDLVALAAEMGHEVVIERGLGSGMGLADEDYLSRSPRIKAGSNEDAFTQDVVVTLRSPETREFDKLRRGATLVSMLHFHTRPARIERLDALGIEAVSLDGIVDDAGKRLVVNAEAVAWNGLEAAFDALEATWPMLTDRDRPLVDVVVLGAGTIGRHAAEAATKFGRVSRRDGYLQAGIPGVVAHTIGRNVTADEPAMRRLLTSADVLVDASQRDDPSTPLIPNAWLKYLPAHAVICDLVVDPYLLDAVPPTVRSIEGIPRGNLDRFVFDPDAPDWCETIPAPIPVTERRTTVTCYSWPGVRPVQCMEHYGAQLGPLLEALLERGGAPALRADGGYLERALSRGRLRTWQEHHSVVRHGGRPSLAGATAR
jgi:alanine dehydrogenase